MYRRFFAFVLSLFLLSTPHPSPAQDAKLRIAMIPQGTNAQVRALADLLMADLSSGNHWELVEREQLDRVFKEQGLAGLQGTNRVTLGKILRADGLVFLAWHAAKEQLRINVVEARQGFQVGAVAYRTKPDAMTGLSESARTDIERMLGKLSTDPSKRVLVSVLRIANATLRPEYLWLEDEAPRLIGECLGMDSRVLILERRQLDHLMGEVEISADALAAFRGAGVILDGEIGVRKGVAFDPKAPPVSFTVRMLGPDLAEQAVVSVDGTLDQVEELVSRGCIEVAKRFKVDAVSGTAGLESKLFLEVAKKHGLLWAAESARALDTSDTNAMKALAIQLIKDNLYANGKPGAPPPKPTLEKARNLARAADLYLALGGDGSIGRLLTQLGGKGFKALLTREFTDDENIREMLQPLRRIGLCTSRAQAGNPEAWQVEESPAYFDNTPDLQSHWRTLLRDFLTELDSGHKKKAFGLMQSLWAMDRVVMNPGWVGDGRPHTWSYYDSRVPANRQSWLLFFNDLSRNTNAIIAFYSSHVMARLSPDANSNPVWLHKMATAGDRVVTDHPDAIISMDRYMKNTFLHRYIGAMMATEVDPAKIYKWIMNPYVDIAKLPNPALEQSRPSVNHYLSFANSKGFRTLPDPQQKILLDKLFEFPYSQLQKLDKQPPSLPTLEALHKALKEKLDPASLTQASESKGKTETVELLSERHPKWRELVEELDTNWSFTHPDRRGERFPGPILLHENRLISVFGNCQGMSVGVAVLVGCKVKCRRLWSRFMVKRSP